MLSISFPWRRGVVGLNAELRGFGSLFVCKPGEQTPEVVALPELTLQNVNLFIRIRSPVGRHYVLQGSNPDTALSRWN
jgi:hypothetical protein